MRKRQKKIYDKGKKTYDVTKATFEMGVAIAENVKEGNSAVVTALEATKDAMDIAALLDPTGVAATMAAYTYPKCSAYFGSPPAVQKAVDVTVEVIEEPDVPFEKKSNTLCYGSKGDAYVAYQTPGCSGPNLQGGKCKYSRPASRSTLHATCLETCNENKDCGGFIQTASTCYYRKGTMGRCRSAKGYLAYIKPQ